MFNPRSGGGRRLCYRVATVCPTNAHEASGSPAVKLQGRSYSPGATIFSDFRRNWEPFRIWMAFLSCAFITRYPFMTQTDQELTTEHSLESDPRFAALAERELVSLAKYDPMAVSYLYRQHYSAIYGYVLRRVGNTHDTHDIVSDVFMTMVRYLPRFRWTGAPFRCWLLVLTATQINRWIRKRRFSSLWTSFESSKQSLTRPIEDRDERLEPIRIALLELPLNFQTALTLHYFEDLSIEAIAKMMRCQPGTVKSRLSRGRELLRQKMTYQEEKNKDERRPVGQVLPKFKV